MTLDELAKLSRTERSKLSRAERGFIRLRDDEVARLVDALDEAPRQTATTNP